MGNFLFSHECPKYLFHLPNPKNDIVLGSQEVNFRHRTKLMVAPNGWFVATASLRYILSRKDRLFHYKKEYSITKILENEVKPLYNRRARKTTAFHEQKQWERPSFKMAHQVIRRKQLRSGTRKTSRILAKKIGGQQIHRILTPLKTYGASFTKLK